MMHQKILSKARSLFILCSILAAMTLTGIQAFPASAASMAFVRIVHASPYVGTVDVFADGNRLLSNFQFATVTDYLPLPSGTHKLQVALIGEGINASVIDQTVSVSPGVSYTIAALGSKRSDLALGVFADNNSITNNQTKLRVYQLSPDTGSVNVLDGNTGTVVQGLSYTQASDYVTFPASARTLSFTSPSTNTTIPVSTTLKSWTVTSIFAIGLHHGNPKLQLITAQVTGMPGMPNTGSDPTPPIAQQQPSSSWLIDISGVLVCGLLIAFALIGYRAGFALRKKRQ